MIWCIAITGSRSASSWNLITCVYQQPAAPSVYVVVSLVFCIALPVLVILVANARILFAIIRVHRLSRAQVNAIGRNDVVTGTSPSLTMRSIRSGKNVLLMCLALVVLTIPLTTYIIATSVRMEHKLPSWYVFVTVWIGMCNPSLNSFM